MQQTTCGVIHKNDVHSGEFIKDFLLKEKNQLISFNNKSCLYSNKKSIKNEILNYLNTLPEDKIESIIKNLILKEFNFCESFYPYLGDIFLSQLFEIDKPSKKRKSFKFNKTYQKKLIESIDNENIKKIISWIIDNTNLNRNIIIETYSDKDILIEVIDNFNFNFSYDFDYFKNSVGVKIKDYKFIVIDGMIETVGEIHHLMFNANKSKLPYVIFCHGVSDDVKYNILKNNSEGRTQILPVNIDFNENTINILNDLAVLHNSSVVSSQLGQTISQEVRKDLSVGKEIIFYKNRLVIKGLLSDKEVRGHRRFLRERIHDANKKGDVNTDVLKNRLRNFSTKSLKIYIPDQIQSDVSVNRELDYALRVLSNLEKDMIVFDSKYKKSYLLPVKYKKLVDEKVNSLKDIMYNIKTIIT
jgi:hypothetical protein